MPSQAAIRSWTLFGEVGELPDVMHCEAIALRSALHGWELAPHRHARLHQFLLVHEGGGRARLEGGDVPLRPRSLVNVPPGDVHAFRFEPGSDGWVVTLPDELVAATLSAAAELKPLFARSWVLVADAPTVRVAGRIAAAFGQPAPARALLLRGLVAELFAQVAALASRRPAVAAAELTESNLLRRFEALLEQHHLAHWTVTRYAHALAITPTHLSRVARAATGQSASRLIGERLMREARRNLAFSSLPVKTIAYALGYGDPAHFCRAFSRHAGCSPRAFRERLAGRSASRA